MKTLTALLLAAALLTACDSEESTPPDQGPDAGGKPDAGPQGPYPWTPGLVEACREYCDAISFAEGCEEDFLDGQTAACRFGCETKLDQIGQECEDVTRYYFDCLESELWLCQGDRVVPDRDHCVVDRSNMNDCLGRAQVDTTGMPGT